MAFFIQFVKDQQKLKWRVWDIKKEVAFEKIKRAYDKSLNVMGILLDDE
jgi:hypothetical protein